MLITEDLLSAPQASKRTFCVFELYSTLDKDLGSSPTKLTVMPCQRNNGFQSLNLRALVSGGALVPDVNIDLQTATCRHAQAKEEIDSLVRNSVGFDHANQMC